MKRIFTILATLAVSFLVQNTDAQSLENPADFTSSIQNPSFENHTTDGWINNGFQLQTNNSPADEGWAKDGNVYIEKWTATPATVADASISQVIRNLPNGNYELRATAHAVNQALPSRPTQGTIIFGGLYKKVINKGGEYTVQTVVANGTLEIGFQSQSTNANWIAADNFRLYYTGETSEGYRNYLNLITSSAKRMLLGNTLPHYNKKAFDNAFTLSKEAGNDIRKLKEAITALEQAVSVYQELAACSTTLHSALVIARQFARNSDYSGKEDFLKAILAAEEAYNATEPDIMTMQEAAVNLQKASDRYLAARPSEWFTIKNGAMWKDNRQKDVQAHGAGFVRVNDTWYMIGEDRSNSWNPDVNMYSSKDLVNWKFERKIIENGVTHTSLGNGRMIERPKLMYCRKTGKFVVWCHWESSNYGASEAGVFYCDSVNGAYKFHWAGRPLGVKSRDCNVFIDDDDTAYFISTIDENRHLGLFRLSDDYLSAVEYTELFKWQSREAPAIVKVNQVYYMLSSACSGWDPNRCKLSYSRSLTSGWSSLSNLGNPLAYDTQAANILTIKGSKATTYLYVGDRWQDPGLPESKTIIFPISFHENRCTFDYHQQFDINFVTGEWRETPDDGTRISKSQWKVIACSSEETNSEQGAARLAIDGNIRTKWHTRYSGTKAEAPHYITVDMGTVHEISGFCCIPRMDDSTNGLIREFTLTVSEDGENWTLATGGSWMPYGSEMYFQPIKARYFKLTSLKGDYASIAEIDMLTQCPVYTATPISPYYKLDTNEWNASRNIVATEGQSVTFGPSVSSGRGTWAIYGPSLHASGREHTLNNVAATVSGSYRMAFLDMYGCTSNTDYQLTVVPQTTSVRNTAKNNREINRIRYYTIGGAEISAPRYKGLYIKKTYFKDHTTEKQKIVL